VPTDERADTSLLGAMGEKGQPRKKSVGFSAQVRPFRQSPQPQGRHEVAVYKCEPNPSD
jgi:hypothetical protein